MKIALVDIETTGLLPTEHEIIEIGMVVFDSNTMRIIEEWSTKVKPVYPENGSPKAYAVNGYNDEDWAEAPDIIPVLETFVEKTKDCVFVAYNVAFDWGFLEFQMTKYGIEHHMSYQKMCLMSMAFAKVPHDKVFSWSLKTVATYLGVPRESATHRAMGGVKCEYGVYCKLMSL